MPRSTVPHESSVSAEVSAAPSTVTLYSPDGEPVQVAADRVDRWLKRGFARELVDLPALAAEVAAYAAALPAPWAAYAEACEAAGHIDNAAQDTARAALELLAEACNRLHLAIHRQYSPAEAGEE